MDKKDETSGLTGREYMDGLRFAELVRHPHWPIFKEYCELYVKMKMENIYNNVEGQLNDDYYRGCGHGIDELLTLLNTRIELALRQQKKEADENSAGDKEN